MALSKEEIELLIRKLEDRYREFAERHGDRWFNIASFRERLLMARTNRMNMEAFILAEISNFETLKKRHDKKKSDHSFAERVDRIMEENLARIKKYPEARFHPRAGVEIAHCYGALAEFADLYLPALHVIAGDAGLRNELISLEEELVFLAVGRGKLQAKRIEDHILILSRPQVTELEVDRDRGEYLKESAFLLHGIEEFCDRLMSRRDPAWEVPYAFAKLHVDDKKKKAMTKLFSGLTGYGAILKVKEQAGNIIDDFRLRAFKKS